MGERATAIAAALPAPVDRSLVVVEPRRAAARLIADSEVLRAAVVDALVSATGDSDWP